jgi:predicted metalloprotease with PDZ domain
MNLIASLLTCLFYRNAASSTIPPAAVTDIRYEITADSAAIAARKLVVVTTFRVASTKPVRLSLPAWLPGYYELERYAREVSNFSAEGNGVPIEWRRVDPQTWEVIPSRAGMIRISFDYAVEGIARSNASATGDFAYFSGAPFLYPVGQGFAWPAHVSILTERGWRVASSMKADHSANTFVATNYHDLIDAPFYIGRFDIDSSRVGNRWLRFAAHPPGTITPARRDGTMRLLETLIREDSTIFGDVPFRDYTVFLVADSGTQGGGFEHQNSQVSSLQPARLDSRDMRDIYSHELFHAWNVKRLRPQEMVPYRYDVAQPTSLLWISEGVTEYYAVMTLSRGVPADSSIAREYLARWIFLSEVGPPTALGDASIATWVEGPGVYYPKGALAGFLIDVMIRSSSNNTHSLDDVMRQLYADAAKSGKGFTRRDWWSAVARNAGGSRAEERFAEFARRYIDGRDPMPVDSIFALAGLGVERRVVPDARSPGKTRTTVRVLSLASASEKAIRIRRSMLTARASSG